MYVLEGELYTSALELRLLYLQDTNQPTSGAATHLKVCSLQIFYIEGFCTLLQLIYDR
jgi:hypothetical protein